MKYALLILVVLLVLWLLRARVRPGANDRAGVTSTSVAAQTMVHCGHCGVHLPRGEALVWRDRFYCDETHRLAEEVKQAKP